MTGNQEKTLRYSLLVIAVISGVLAPTAYWHTAGDGARFVPPANENAARAASMSFNSLSNIYWSMVTINSCFDQDNDSTIGRIIFNAFIALCSTLGTIALALNPKNILALIFGTLSGVLMTYNGAEKLIDWIIDKRSRNDINAPTELHDASSGLFWLNLVFQLLNIRGLSGFWFNTATVVGDIADHPGLNVILPTLFGLLCAAILWQISLTCRDNAAAVSTKISLITASIALTSAMLYVGFTSNKPHHGLAMMSFLPYYGLTIIPTQNTTVELWQFFQDGGKLPEGCDFMQHPCAKLISSILFIALLFWAYINTASTHDLNQATSPTGSPFGSAGRVLLWLIDNVQPMVFSTYSAVAIGYALSKKAHTAQSYNQLS